VSVFPTYSLDRNVIRWEDYLGQLTPVENRQGVWFKRDDLFLPLGPGGLGGSKCRQLIWYMNRYREGKTHVLSGASIQSPQLLMSTIVGQHFALPSRLVVYSKPATVLRHASPRISAGFGATFEYANGPYNPIIQRKVADLTRDDSLVVHYGITVDHKLYDADTVRKFHEVGANQTRNIPDEVETVIFPAGSCNSICSFLLGLSRDPKNVKTVVAMQIGPDKRDWLFSRLRYIGVDPDQFPFEIKWVSLHDTKFAAYSDHMPESFDGINFHPVYEGKMWRWLKQNGGVTGDDKTLFWIVGGQPDPKAMEKFYTTKLEEVV
jgi:1-aminocyclopropane-1-carboxylate deaminase/D-cysteine desulfhydrase-like pyridoxal-dependent ACC family enzyme